MQTRYVTLDLRSPNNTCPAPYATLVQALTDWLIAKKMNSENKNKTKKQASECISAKLGEKRVNATLFWDTPLERTIDVQVHVLWCNPSLLVTRLDVLIHNTFIPMPQIQMPLSSLLLVAATGTALHSHTDAFSGVSSSGTTTTASGLLQGRFNASDLSYQIEDGSTGEVLMTGGPIAAFMDGQWHVAQPTSARSSEEGVESDWKSVLEGQEEEMDDDKTVGALHLAASVEVAINVPGFGRCSGPKMWWNGAGMTTGASTGEMVRATQTLAIVSMCCSFYCLPLLVLFASAMSCF